MPAPIKISSPETHGFWELPVLFEDEWLLAVDKPAELHTVKEAGEPGHPGLMTMLHAAMEARKPWASERNLSFLTHTHRLDQGTSGVLLLAKDKDVAGSVMNLFGSENPLQRYLALVQGEPPQERFDVQLKMEPHPLRPGTMHVEQRHGKKSRTEFQVVERFSRWVLLACTAFTDRPHQVRLHVRYARLSLVADELYHGGTLMLSSIKPGFVLKPNKTERPLMSRPALHLENISMPHPVTGQELSITAPLPKDLAVALKYLRKYAAAPQALPPKLT